MSGNTNYKKNYQKQKQTQISATERNVINEFSSYYAHSNYTVSQAASNYYFGLDVLDLYSYEDLMGLIKDPMTNNRLLRDLSLTLYGTNGTYTHTVDYMVAMPILDRVTVLHGKSTPKKKKNKELMEATLKTIRDKEFVRDALWRGMVEGVAFYYFETTGKPKTLEKYMNDFDVESIVEINEVNVNASIISLPADYTKIVGRKNNSYVIAFNLDYFKDFSGEPVERKLKKFPAEIREAYKNHIGAIEKNKGNWVVLDNNKTIVHKVRSKISEPWGRPLVLAAINDILYDNYFTATKRNVLGEINNKVIYQTLPEGRDKGTCALTKAQQKEQHDTVKSAVMKKNNRGGTSFFTVSAGTKLNTLDVGNSDIFDSKYESNLGDKIALGCGIAGALINGVGSGSYSAQQQNLELITGLIFQWIDQISTELNKCISKNIIGDGSNWAEFKYLRTTFVNRSEMVNNAKDLYLQGKGPLSLWASACGISPDVFFALLDQELEEDIENKYPIHATSYTLSNSDKKSGRPETDNPSDRTVQSRANNGNSLPSPSDK